MSETEAIKESLTFARNPFLGSISQSMGTIHRQRTGTAACSVCGHAEADALMTALASGERVADLAARYEVSAAAIYRHQRNHAAVMSAFDIDTDSSLSMVDRLVGIMDRARAASQLACERGDLRAGALIGDAAVRAANSLQGFGVNSEKIAADYREADRQRRRAFQLSRAVEDAVEWHPEIAVPLSVACDANGLPDIAAALRADDPNPDHHTLEMNA